MAHPPLSMRWKKVAVSSLLSISSVFTNAQPMFREIPCIDTMAVNTDFVFLATISGICGEVKCGQGSNVNVKIERWLKGAGQSGGMQAHIDSPATVLSSWKEHGNRLLLFSDGRQGETAIDLSAPDLKVLTAGMNVLSDPGRVIEATLRAIERHPNITGMFIFRRNLPLDVSSSLGGSGGLILGTDVPVDADLEQWALATLGSDNDFARMEAAKALRYFPSQANVDRLKLLLADPALSSGSSVETYYVRQAAYESLSIIGVTVPKPVLKNNVGAP